jgi:hypothetical protein
LALALARLPSVRRNSPLLTSDFQLPNHLNQKVTFAKKNSIMFSTEGKKLLAERLEALRRYL